jgi:hypothetical protein
MNRDDVCDVWHNFNLSRECYSAGTMQSEIVPSDDNALIIYKT